MSLSVIRILPVLVVAVVTSTPQALACTFHMTSFGTFFESTYPGSLNVSLAVAKARSEEQLPGAPLEDGDLGLLRASHELKKLGTQLDAASESARSDFFLLLAGQQLWTNYRAKGFGGGPGYDVHVHSARPTHDVPIVVTSYFVVLALKDGTMTFEEALDRGLVRIDNDENGKVAALFREIFSGAESSTVS